MVPGVGDSEEVNLNGKVVQGISDYSGGYTKLFM